MTVSRARQHLVWARLTAALKAGAWSSTVEAESAALVSPSGAVTVFESVVDLPSSARLDSLATHAAGLVDGLGRPEVLSALGEHEHPALAFDSLTTIGVARYVQECLVDGENYWDDVRELLERAGWKVRGAETADLCLASPVAGLLVRPGDLDCQSRRHRVASLRAIVRDSIRVDATNRRSAGASEALLLIGILTNLDVLSA